MDPDSGSSVTLIYYRIGERWWKEPFLNVVAAAAQMSSLTHVEIAIGGNECCSNHAACAPLYTRMHRVPRRGAGKQWNDEQRLQSVQRQGASRALVCSTSDLLIGMRRMCTGGRRTRRAHRPQSALCLPEPWVLQDGRGAHAALRQDAVRGQAVFQHGHGEESAVATTDRRHQLFLCRHVRPRLHSFAASRYHRTRALIFARSHAQNWSPPS